MYCLFNVRYDILGSVRALSYNRTACPTVCILVQEHIWNNFCTISIPTLYQRIQTGTTISRQV